MYRILKMHFLKNTLLILLLLSFAFTSAAQENNDYEYKSEIIWGINKNTNGGLIGGVFMKYGKQIKPKLYTTYGLELSNVKHPKEQRIPTLTGSSYIDQKVNYLYAIRLQYGIEKILFKKAPQQGAQVNALVAVGPTFGVVAPYFISVNQDNEILGSAKLFHGLGDSKIKLGGNLKAAINFEFGTFKRNVTGFEFGFMVEAFPNEIVILKNATNKSVYTSAYISIFYGRRK